MKSYFKLELKKNLISLKMLISILIILVTFIIPYLEELKFPYPGLDGVDYFIRIHQFSYISFVGPVVAGLIYSTSIIKDKESGFINKLLEVIDIKSYFKVKLAVNAVMSCIIFVVSYSIFILYLIMNFGINNYVGENINNGAFVIHAFIGLYQTSKISYIIILLLLTAISAVAFSTFTLGITTVIGRRLTAYIVPIFFVILTGIFFEIWSLNSVLDFNIIRIFDLTENNFINHLGVIVYDLMLTLLGMGLLYKFSYKRNLLYLSDEI